MNTFYNATINQKNNYYGYCLMTCDELIKRLGSLNKEWKKSFEESNQDLINKAHELEEELSRMNKLNRSNDIEVIELKGSKIQILEIIVDSFKKSTNMSDIPVHKRKFLYKNKEDLPEYRRNVS